MQNLVAYCNVQGAYILHETQIDWIFTVMKPRAVTGNAIENLLAPIYTSAQVENSKKGAFLLARSLLSMLVHSNLLYR
jgi:hypothetical protein